MAYLESEQMLYRCRNKLCDYSETRQAYFNGYGEHPKWEEKVVCPKCGGLNLYKASILDKLTLLGLDESEKE